MLVQALEQSVTPGEKLLNYAIQDDQDLKFKKAYYLKQAKTTGKVILP